MAEDLPSNSHKSKETRANEEETKEKKTTVKPVVKGEVTVRKQSLMARFKNTFFGGDFTAVASYVGREVFLPALRNLVVETATKSVEKAIYGDTQPRRTSVVGGAPRYRYDTPMRRQPEPRRRYEDPVVSRGGRRPIDYGDILVTHKEDAERVVETLIEIVEQYGKASVAELLELLGQPSSHTETKWGWTELPFARTVQTRDGWLLDLPPVEPISV